MGSYCPSKNTNLVNPHNKTEKLSPFDPPPPLNLSSYECSTYFNNMYDVWAIYNCQSLIWFVITMGSYCPLKNTNRVNPQNKSWKLSPFDPPPPLHLSSYQCSTYLNNMYDVWAIYNCQSFIWFMIKMGSYCPSKNTDLVNPPNKSENLSPFDPPPPLNPSSYEYLTYFTNRHDVWAICNYQRFIWFMIKTGSYCPSKNRKSAYFRDN